jgi:hypothetical protein
MCHTSQFETNAERNKNANAYENKSRKTNTTLDHIMIGTMLCLTSQLQTNAERNENGKKDWTRSYDGCSVPRVAHLSFTRNLRKATWEKKRRIKGTRFDHNRWNATCCVCLSERNPATDEKAKKAKIIRHWITWWLVNAMCRRSVSESTTEGNDIAIKRKITTPNQMMIGRCHVSNVFMTKECRQKRKGKNMTLDLMVIDSMVCVGCSCLKGI